MSLFFFVWMFVKSFVLMVVQLWPYAIGAAVLMAVPRLSEKVRQFSRGGV